MMDTDSWSKRYYYDLTEAQHRINDAWFHEMLSRLTSTGVLIVPGLGLVFDKEGEEI
jgi:hypothetical protein